MYVKNQVFFILGVSKSGTSAAKCILERGGKCYIYEELKSEKIEKSISELVGMGAIYVDFNSLDSVLEKIDVLVISPGVAINHSVAIKAKNLNKRIIGELELGYQLLMPTIVAVTGTNGKTTTVSFIDAIFKQAGIKSVLCGNVGIPITSELSNIDGESVCVVEVSSFQLESIGNFLPHISCFLNISPDHLERHYTMENYIFLKKRIFKKQLESEYTILNYDDELIRSFGQEVKSKPIYVSISEQVDGAYLDERGLCYKNELILSEKDLPIRGEHNFYDALFSIAVAKIMGVKNDDIAKALKEFKGVRHRIELIGEKAGIKFYDDSKATNTASSISAIKTMCDPTVLILGGSEKGEDYKNLFSEILSNDKIIHTVITGASSINMQKCAEEIGYKNYTLTSDFRCAVKIAKIMAKSGGSVLLSPACASFDKFKNFEERGEVFSQIALNDD